MKGVGDLFDGYGEAARGLTKAAFDEMVGHDGAARSPYAGVASSLSQMGPEDVSARATRLARAFMDQGVTFDLDGEERPFPLDVVPRIFTAGEWREVSTGVAQRVRALEAFLADVYGAARIVSDGLIPHEVITSSPGFVRAAFGLTPPNGVRIHVAGIDVIRDEEGEFRVLEDNVRSPSGVSYVLANRAAMARVLPELFWGQPIQMVTDYPAHLIHALRRAAPTGVQDPTVVVLTPGVHNSAFYEHALLARLMGVHLVEGRDLVCHGTEVFLRTTEGEVPVHVIYRRIDDDYLDPLQFRPESLVGCPGVVNAARAGRVTITNGVGNGVADDKLVYAYVPAMIKYYLGEDPILQNVETMHLRTAPCELTHWPGATSWSSSGWTARAARGWSSARPPRGASWISWLSRWRMSPGSGSPSASLHSPPPRPGWTAEWCGATWTCAPLPSTTAKTSGSFRAA